MPAGGRVVIGRVVKPHGIRGELVVEATGDTLPGLDPGVEVWLGDRRTAILIGLRPHQGRWLVRVDGCGDRDDAEALRGAALQVTEAELAKPGDDEWFVNDLMGWEIRGRDGRGLGAIIAVIPGGAHDTIETSAGHLIPMVKAWLVATRPAQKVLVVDVPDGLTAVAEGDR